MLIQNSYVHKVTLKSSKSGGKYYSWYSEMNHRFGHRFQDEKTSYNKYTFWSSYFRYDMMVVTYTYYIYWQVQKTRRIWHKYNEE